MADGSRFRLSTAFPLITLVVIIYNHFAFFGPAFMGGATAEGAPAPTTVEKVENLLRLGFDFGLISGDVWRMGIGDILIFLGLILLLLEVIRSTQTSSSAIANHAFSMLLFVVCLIEFIVLKGFGTSVFFTIICMTLFDVVAGFTVGIVAARRDFGGGGIVVGGDRN